MTTVLLLKNNKMLQLHGVEDGDPKDRSRKKCCTRTAPQRTTP